MARKINKRKKIYLILFFVSIFFFCIDIFLIYNHVDINKRKKDSFISNYTESSAIDYQINLAENEYITNENLGSSNSYILKYTDNINFHLIYNYLSSNNITTTANYEIYIIISGKYKSSTDNGEEIYTKKIPLESGSINSISNAITINKEVQVDINNYNKILSDLQKDIKLPMTGDLTLYLDVNTEDEEGNEINSYRQTVVVSLLSEIYTVEAATNEPITNSIYSDNLEINYFYLTGLGLAFLILTFVSLILIKEILEKKIPRGLKEVKKYLKVYDDYIVNTKTKIDEEKYKVVNITEFKELLTLAINNNTSIMYYSFQNKSTFYIIIDDNLYKYVIDHRG